jgi:hypothetical protein
MFIIRNKRRGLPTLGKKQQHPNGGKFFPANINWMAGCQICLVFRRSICILRGCGRGGVNAITTLALKLRAW